MKNIIISKYKQSGFSLIEMAIVIIIIGILVGGILGGKELMKSGNISALVTEMSYYRQAHNDFVDKYKYRPGDVPSSQAATFFPGNGSDMGCSIDTALLGNGRWSNGSGVDIWEVDLAWNQLSYASFIDQKISFACIGNSGGRDVGTHRPASKVDGLAGYTFYDMDSVVVGANTYRFSKVLHEGGKSGASDKYLTQGVFTVDVHRAIDAKIDQPDTPFSGKYFVDVNCIDTSTGLYKDETTGVNCTAGFAEKDLSNTTYHP